MDAREASAFTSSANCHRSLIPVVMPSGDLETISFISPEASVMTKMVDLKTLREMGARELDLIAKEMQRTIVLESSNTGCFSQYEIISILKLINTKTWNKYLKKKNEMSKRGEVVEHMLFHGTPETLNIYANGFDVAQGKPGEISGQSIYFTPLSSKSNEYAWGCMGDEGCPTHQNKNCYLCTRSMLLCRVILHKSNPETSEGVTSNGRGQSPSDYSTRGNPVRNPEYAVHHSDQAYPEYLIMYKIVK